MKYKGEKYALLENTTIEPLYYDNECKERRMFYPEGRSWYLDHDKFGNGCCIRFHHKIIRFGNTKKELKEYLRNEKKSH